jgi:hypothetical protein
MWNYFPICMISLHSYELKRKRETTLSLSPSVLNELNLHDISNVTSNAQQCIWILFQSNHLIIVGNLEYIYAEA